MGFVFQDHYLLPQCTVLENILIPTLAGNGADKPAEDRARFLLERVGLSQRMAHRPAELSGGERQRVAICRALINRPSLLLADEPTGNLDRHTAESVGTLLLELSREERAILIVVTHSAELAERLPRRCELVEGGCGNEDTCSARDCRTALPGRLRRGGLIICRRPGRAVLRYPKFKIQNL